MQQNHPIKLYYHPHSILSRFVQLTHHLPPRAEHRHTTCAQDSSPSTFAHPFHSHSCSSASCRYRHYSTLLHSLLLMRLPPQLLDLGMQLWYADIFHKFTVAPTVRVLAVACTVVYSMSISGVLRSCKTGMLGRRRGSCGGASAIAARSGSTSLLGWSMGCGVWLGGSGGVVFGIRGP